MEIICSNCSETLYNTSTLNFCQQCGQKKFRRIDKKYLFEEIQYTLVHINKGFLYSIKCLLKNPGQTAKGYIFGSRVNHYKPILLAVILSGVFGFLGSYVLKSEDVLSAYLENEKVQDPISVKIVHFALQYQNIITLILIPLFAILTRFTFRRQQENYFEHVIMNAYLQSMFSLFYIILYCPVAFFLKNTPNLFMSFGNLFFLIYPAILIWFFKTYYTEIKLSKIVLNVLMMFIISIISMLIVSTTLVALTV